MAVTLGRHAERLSGVRALRTPKGRREQRRFAFEGAVLLEEARRSAYPVEEIYATGIAYEGTPLVRELEGEGVPVFVVDDRAAAKISDLESPPGIVAVAPARLTPAEAVFGEAGCVLVLADLNDPGNAGTLLRSADAFGCRGVVFGATGVDPYHPKVVRSAMGAIFRLQLAVLAPAEAARAGNYTFLGLAAHGAALEGSDWPERAGIVVGNERHGLGEWAAICSRLLSIPMPGGAESLNAAVAGSIALYARSLRVSG
ncbi:MAG: RNA methyltransferase [Candidatus Eremiobacteraeota bacterium]|nr:RNA methyltransferase [Candidatus Eremiobacteraeota bacterium]